MADAANITAHMLSNLFACVLLLSTSQATAASSADIDRYVAEKMRGHRMPGLALVVIRDGAVVHRRGFGELQTSSPVIIGSLSKAFTATAVLQLAEQGRIALDAPVREYLPEFAPADPLARRITVRQLLHQTSGIPTSAPRASHDASLAEHVAALRDLRLAATPGTRHEYSSPNYQVLGRLVEVVSGEPFDVYVQRHIFTPLQMTQSGGDASRVPPAPGHNLWWGFSGPALYRWERGRLPTASLITSADDLSRFALAHLGIGAPILQQASLAEAHRGVGPGEGFSYAMGWREGTTVGVPSLWHGGALPSYRGAVVLIPQTRSAVIVLTNASTMFADHTREIAAGVVALTHGRPLPAGVRPLRDIYVVIAIASALLLLLVVRALVRAIRKSEKPQRRAKVIVFDVLLPLALLIFVPRMVHVSWRGIAEATPDIALTTVVAFVLALITGLVRLRNARATARAA